VLLFGFQGDAIIRLPLVIAMLGVPILIQVYFCSPDLVVSTIIDPNQ
jgi:ACR3 family arsenite transporter